MPFIFLALLIPLSLDYRLLFAIALVNYGAVILSFVGALHWGFAMTVRDMSAEQRRDQFIWSVIPALIAWIATLLPMPLGCLLLVIGFVVHLRQDRQLLRVMSMPAWYMPMRLWLNVLCVHAQSAARKRSSFTRSQALSGSAGSTPSRCQSSSVLTRPTGDLQYSHYSGVSQSLKSLSCQPSISTGIRPW